MDSAIIGVPAAPGTLPAGIWSAVGAVFLAVFIFRQISLQRTGYPLLDLRTFESRNFTVSVLLMAIMMMALFGTIILLPIYLQNVLGLSTLQTGLLLLPGGLLMGLLGPHVGRLYDKMGPIRLMVPGVIVVSAVLWAMTLLGPTTWVGYILAGHVVMSIGFAFLFTPLFTTSLSSVKPSLYSHGSAVIGTVQQVAGAAGVALFVALMSARATTLSRTRAWTCRCAVGRHPGRLSLRRHHLALRRSVRFFRAEALLNGSDKVNLFAQAIATLSRWAADRRIPVCSPLPCCTASKRSSERRWKSSNGSARPPLRVQSRDEAVAMASKGPGLPDR